MQQQQPVMDPTREQQHLRIVEAITMGINELVASLPSQFSILARSVLPLVRHQVESASPDDLLRFVIEARNKLNELLGEAPQAAAVVEGELVPDPTQPGLLPHMATDPLGGEYGEWYDPVTGTTVVRQPTIEDAEAIAGRLEELAQKAMDDPEGSLTPDEQQEVQLLAAAAAVVMPTEPEEPQEEAQAESEAEWRERTQAQEPQAGE